MIRLLYISCFMVVTAVIFHGSPLCNESFKHDGPPDTVSIDALSSLYEAVAFNHQLHADYAACSECHHHTTGGLPSRPYCAACHHSAKKANSVACRSCHPAQENSGKQGNVLPSAHKYHIDVPGLIGAYHLQCIDCHEGIGTGPVQCSECHAMTAKGKEFFLVDKATELRVSSHIYPR